MNREFTGGLVCLLMNVFLIVSFLKCSNSSSTNTVNFGAIFLCENMVEEYRRTGFGQVDIVDDDNMVRLPRQRIVDMYKNAMSRVRVLEAKTNEGTILIANCILKIYFISFICTNLLRKSD